MRSHLNELGGHVAVQILPDEDGYVGRECPEPDCEGYFKIVPGTGLTGTDLPCHCPYCGHEGPHNGFWTKEQIEYARSVAMRKVVDALHADLKQLEFSAKPSGAFGIGLSIQIRRGSPVPIHYYRERQLETEVVCVACTLRYSVYGVFAFCPDCGAHNSLQIFEKNLLLATKMLDLAASAQGDMVAHLVENALEDCVSAFDGFGREICRAVMHRQIQASDSDRLSFQNLAGAKRSLQLTGGIDLAGGVTADEWNVAIRGFHKRHVLSHRMGVIDAEYVRKSGDSNAVAGRRVQIDPDEVRELARIVGKLARHLAVSLAPIEKKP